MSIISSIFGIEPSLAAKTVDGVMAAFHETIAKLKDVALHHNEKAEAHRQAIEQHSDERNASIAEAQRATDIAAKLADVVGTPAAAPAEPFVKLAA